MLRTEVIQKWNVIKEKVKDKRKRVISYLEKWEKEIWTNELYLNLPESVFPQKGFMKATVWRISDLRCKINGSFGWDTHNVEWN